MRWRNVAAALAIVVAALVALALASGFLVDWVWFASLGFVAVFWTAEFRPTLSAVEFF